MDPHILKGLNHVKYENRKTAALDLDRLLRECLVSPDPQQRARIPIIMDQLCVLFTTGTNSQASRNGGLLGLAAAAIALGPDFSPYLPLIVPPILSCFSDPDSRMRYFGVECIYNIGKVVREELLLFFNEIFDDVNKLSGDPDAVVRNGAELLDRLLKDMVAESAASYTIPRQHAGAGDAGEVEDGPLFSLERFIPLLSERIYVLSPHTRLHLTSWITVLDSVPELELVAYLPSFLDGLLKYLADENHDVRMAAESCLSDFLREIREIAKIKRLQQEEAETRARQRSLKRRGSKTTVASSLGEKEDWGPDDASSDTGAEPEYDEEGHWDEAGNGSWVPGQGVEVGYGAIVQILLKHVTYPNENIQALCLRWLSDFISFAQDVMIPVTPQLIPAILPSLAHPTPIISAAASETNRNLYRQIQSLPPPSTATPSSADPTSRMLDSITSQLSGTGPSSTGASNGSIPSRRDSAAPPEDISSRSPQDSSYLNSSTSTIKPILRPVKTESTITESPVNTPSISHDGLQLGHKSGSSIPGTAGTTVSSVNFPSTAASPTITASQEEDPFDYQAAVNALTLQFLSDFEETRVAALEWLLMLHQKAPKKILAMDDGTFPVLLKTLSDPAEEVIKRDLKLLAQISSSSEDSYFTSFMVNLLELFSTDRRLLETRGSLIIRQLCLNLNSERIYRTLAEILEKEEDLEFAGSMVQKLNIILITSSELLDFRKRLKNLDSKDGQMLFSIIYRSWCHSPVAVFSLCLLAQAYEHASNLLQLFAELDTTLQLLVQIDKLVQLIESPVFTSLRLQLLEPEKYPYLFKCLYGLLMLLPQSTAFVSLRNRLNAVSSMGFLHIPKPTYASSAAAAPRSKLGSPDEIKWRELLSHFRAVQARHEKARRSSSQQTNGGHESSTWQGFDQVSSRQASVTSIPSMVPPPKSQPTRRRFGASLPSRGDTPSLKNPDGQRGTSSPLNPTRSRGGVTWGSSAAEGSGGAGGVRSQSPVVGAFGQKGKKPGAGSSNTGGFGVGTGGVGGRR